MDAKLREQVRAWKASMEEMNRVALAEKRSRTPAERLKLLQAFLNGHAQLAIAREKPGRRTHRMPYSEVQERLLARSSKRFCRD